MYQLYVALLKDLREYRFIKKKKKRCLLARGLRRSDTVSLVYGDSTLTGKVLRWYMTSHGRRLKASGHTSS